MRLVAALGWGFCRGINGDCFVEEEGDEGEAKEKEEDE